MADFGKTQYEYVTGELQTLTLLSPLNRKQHGGHAKLCDVENMTNTQNKLLKVVRDITEQSVNHNFFSFFRCFFLSLHRAFRRYIYHYTPTNAPVLFTI
jgi:hypothetical protein